jgi:hypothetical protein
MTSNASSIDSSSRRAGITGACSVLPAPGGSTIIAFETRGSTLLCRHFTKYELVYCYFKCKPRALRRSGQQHLRGTVLVVTSDLVEINTSDTEFWNDQKQ